MKFPKLLHIALGSNVGNRFAYLQKAIRLIFEEIGDIGQISKVYQTPALGFKGNPFLNACLSLSTRFSAEECLQKMLAIEDKLGRQRSNNEAYENRCIDLDLLLAENQVTTSKHLVLPHPHMQNRRFVLQPLADIAGFKEHPVLKKTINTLLKETTDSSQIEAITQELELPSVSVHFKNYNYLAVEGNIGAGKTSFASMVSQDFNAKLILERFKDNAFLPKFYEDKERYAFSLEMSFLADRYQQLSDDLAQFDLFKDFIISDYDVFKSLIFAKITLQEDEFSLYQKLFHLMYKELVKPGLYIYLYQNTERLLQNIKKRGREYEQSIDAEYLLDINQSYLSFIKSQTSMQVQIIDISEKDFVNQREDYLAILREIKQPS